MLLLHHDYMLYSNVMETDEITVKKDTNGTVSLFKKFEYYGQAVDEMLELSKGTEFTILLVEDWRQVTLKDGKAVKMINAYDGKETIKSHPILRDWKMN